LVKNLGLIIEKVGPKFFEGKDIKNRIEEMRRGEQTP
jgi:hypothetical protein